MKTQAGIVLRHLRGLASPTGVGDAPDAQLLERFTARREEAAFAALVRRHGPMVLGVCRRVLRQEQDAEDAFQAAFLALARKAPSISKRDSVGSWLYQVAYHVAIKARERTANRQKRERRTAARQPGDPLAEITGRELLAAFDEELARLPERQRAPLVLCYLQGLTRDAAARQLGCSESTLHRRLDEARARLRERLGRRGLALPAMLLAAGTVAVTVPRSLAAAGVRSALGTASEAVTALAREALSAMPRRASKALGALLLTAALVAATAGLVGSSPPAAVGGNPPPADTKAPNPPAPAKPADAEKADFTVKGTVVGADGKPIPDAKVAVIAPVEQLYRGQVGERGHKVLASGRADKDGHFRLDCAPATPSRKPVRQVVASAPDHGLGYHLLADGDDKSDLKIELPPERLIRGRLLDLQGQPARGVSLHVADFVLPHGPGGSSGSSTTGGLGGGGGSATFARPAPVSVLPAWYEFPTQPAGLDAWPAAVKTDDDGRFVVSGVGKGQTVTLQVNDERFAPHRLVVGETAKGAPESAGLALEPAHWLEGKVVGEDTGRPIGKKVLLHVNTRDGVLQGWAGEKGHFRVNCPPGRLNVEPYPPDGSPYLARAKSVDWPKGQAKYEVEVALPRGVLIRGKVTEAVSGKPVSGAALTYTPRQDNPFRNFAILSWRRSPGEYVRTREDGTFEAAVYPGAGTLLAKGPTRDYVLQRFDTREPLEGRRASPALYTEGIAPLDLKADADAPKVALKLRRGATVKGRVLDPDGKPVKSAVLYYPLGLRENGDVGYFRQSILEPVAVKDGAFVLTGLDPKATVPVFVLDRANLLGARAVISGKADETPTVKLQPCGRATGRILDREGKPAKGLVLGLTLVMDDDPLSFLSQTELLGGKRTQSDEEGHATVEGLIPGATYRYSDGKKSQEFTAESGKTRDLGDTTRPGGRGFGGGGGGPPMQPPEPSEP
jgi:RNA polymerase sigma factor (sigma-70 family)